MVVVAAAATARERKAVEMLVEEVAKRTNVRLQDRRKMAAGWHARDCRGSQADSIGKSFAGRFAGKVKGRASRVGGAEGYRVCVRQDDKGAAAFVIGQ